VAVTGASPGGPGRLMTRQTGWCPFGGTFQQVIGSTS
jgi:hypothetical protein